MRCYYCDLIVAADPAYVSRPAEFDLGSEAPRCAWHWRFVCDHCGQSGHFMMRHYCPETDRLLCRDAGEVRKDLEAFWAWEYRVVLVCPECAQPHPALDYAEFAGVHPWQRHPTNGAARRWLSTEPYLVRYPPARFPRADIASLTDADSDASWSASADIWEAGYDERGDRNRKYHSDPVLLELLGEVAGQRILDAGSGAGYLSRMLARRGAHMVAVENAGRLYEIALEHHRRDPQDIEFHHASISSMPFLPDGSFAAAVTNYVLMDVRDYEGAIREIARVLRRGGRFVCAISHSSPDFRDHLPAADSPRREDRAGWIDDDYFVRRAGYVQWGQLQPLLTFHRPLRDYVWACKAAGLLLRDLEEPQLSEEGRRELPPDYIRWAERAPYSYVLKFIKG